MPNIIKNSKKRFVQLVISRNNFFIESEENDTINLEYSAAVVEKVIQYLYYKLRYDHDPDSRPPFIVEPEIALNLMVAAHHLET
jgi:hypothetical protein